MSKPTADTFSAHPVVEPPARPSAPVDTDDPVAISHRLGEIEDEIAMLAPPLAYAAARVVELKRQIARTELSLWPQAKGAVLRDRQAAVQQLLEAHPAKLLDKQMAAEAHLKMHSILMEALDSRKSILQSVLKRHTQQASSWGKGEGGA